MKFVGSDAVALHVRQHRPNDVEVRGAALQNGLLHIDLVREIPEALKPRKIAIAAAPSPKVAVTGVAEIQAKAA